MLHNKGTRVTNSGRSKVALDALKSQLSEVLDTVVYDVAKKEDSARLTWPTVQTYRRFDILFINAVTAL